MREGIPLYVQIRNQIRMLILSGILSPGQKLPGVRQIANYLSINRHTVSRALRDLESTGLIVKRRGSGTRVANDIPVAEMHKREFFNNLIQKTISEAQSLGYSVEELSEAILNVTKGDYDHQKGKNKVCFIECNQISLEQYSLDLRNELGVEIRPILLSQLLDEIKMENNLINQCDLVVTTLGHMPEVKQILGDAVEIFPISVGPYLEVFFDVLNLPGHYIIGIVTASERGAVGMKQAMVQAGISEQRLCLASLDRPDLIEEALEKSNALVVSFAAMETVKHIKGKKEIEIFEYRNLLHQGDLDVLKQFVWDTSEKDTKIVTPGEIDVADIKRALLEE